MANPNPNPSATTQPVVPPVAAPVLAPVQITSGPTLDGAPTSETLYGPQGPTPSGTKSGAVAEMERENQGAAPDAGGIGIEGETVVWEGSYSMRNFLGRLVFRIALTIVWLVLAVYTWGYGHIDLLPVTLIAALALIVLWATVLYRMAHAKWGHGYQLTTRRLFVATGLMRRRQDQMELLRVKDVFTRQSLLERWMELGTVVVVSSERELPVLYVAGVTDPKGVMDLIWHHARAERDLRATKIDSI